MKKLAYLTLVALTVLVSACKKNEDEKVLSFEKTDVLFTYEEGETSLKAETSSELKDATSDADWCTATAKKNMLAIKVTENVAKEPRSASVTVKNGDGLSQKFNIVQNGAKYIFDASDLEIPAAGGSITAEYYAQNKGVVVVPTDVKWLKATATKDGFILTADPNETVVARTAKVSYAVSSKSGTFNVTQLGADPYLDTDAADIDASYEGDTYEFTFKSNTTATATCEADWVKVNVADNKLTVVVDMNYETEERSTTLNYGIAKTDISGSIAISQEAAPAVKKVISVIDAEEADVTELSVKSSASEASFIVKSNASWTAVSSADWVTVTPASKEYDKNQPVSETVTVKVAENPDGVARTATITVSAPDVEENGTIEITVNQAPSYKIEIEMKDITGTTATAEYTPNNDEYLYLTNLMAKEYWEEDTPEANAEYFIEYLAELGESFGMDLPTVIGILAYQGADSDDFDELDPETDYVTFAFVCDEEGNILSDVFTEGFTTGKDPWTYIGKGEWKDSFATEWFNMEEEPWAVDVYENDDTPGLYAVDTPYGPVGMASLFGLSVEECEGYEGGNWKHVRVLFDATDPTKVHMPFQEIGFCANSNYGWFSVGSEYNTSVISTGTLVNGKITFPANGMLKSMSKYNSGNLYYANVEGGFYLTIPAAGTTAAPKAVKKTSRFSVDMSRFSRKMDVKVPFKASGVRFSK